MKAPRGEIKRIRVEMGSEVFGGVAVHPTIPNDGDSGGMGWTVTHVRTGMSLLTNIKERAAALRLASRIGGLDWAFKNAKNCPPETFNVAKAAIRRFRGERTRGHLGARGERAS